MDDFQSIKIIPGRPLKIHNPTSFPLLGQGAQGAVFKLNRRRCAKIYVKERDVEREAAVLKAAKGSAFFPKLYKTGPNFVVMEYVKGPTLAQYLKKKKRLPKRITRQIIAMIKEMKRFKLTRLDADLRHLLVAEDRKKPGRVQLKVIDHVNSFRKEHSYPKLILHGLERLDLKKSFFKQVKDEDKDLYREWSRMDKKDQKKR